jgi:hypothetical protein
VWCAACSRRRSYSTYRQASLRPTPSRDKLDFVAQGILVEVLYRDLAYGLEVMDRTAAEALAAEFMEAFPPPAHFLTNGDDIRPGMTHTMSRGWTPATDATLDCGVLAVGVGQLGALWVEDED